MAPAVLIFLITDTGIRGDTRPFASETVVEVLHVQVHPDLRRTALQHVAQFDESRSSRAISKSTRYVGRKPCFSQRLGNRAT